MNRPVRREAASTSGGAAARLTMLLLLAGGAVLTGLASVREWRIHQSDDDLRSIEIDPEARPAIPDLSATLSPRSALTEALVQIRVATNQTDPTLRARRLAAARTLLAKASAGRPNWPQVGIVESYIDTAQFGPRSPQALAAFRASFAGNGYYADSAPWRIRYGLDQWAMLDAATRQHVVDQAAWYASLRRGSFDTMVAIAGHPAEVPIMRERADITRTAQASMQQD